MIETVTGYCPTLKCEYSIDVNYSHIADDRYLKAGADCEHFSDILGSGCPIQKECPLYLSAPKEIRR